MNKADLLLNYLIAHFLHEKNVNEISIDFQIGQFREMPMFRNESDEFFSFVKASYTSKIAITLERGAVIDDKNHRKWFYNRKTELEMKYWERYKKYLLLEKKFPAKVVNVMDDVLDSLTDLLGDPESDFEYQRRGLIIGDVQSGKTANYTGLICKAADTNYKAIILLTGTIEKLRRQTQMRLDEGFVGFDSSALLKDKNNKDIGVGKIDKSIRAVALTSTSDDFKSKTANNLGFDLNSLSNPVLFVVKKNVSVLKRLNKWLCTFNRNGESTIDHSLLLIDDEADNASVNTNPEDKNPTKINEQIRGILGAFGKASYVGYTATPYANIFIDPDSENQMKNEDLFPKDYICSLDPPSNYIGARDIFGDGNKYASICRIFNFEEEEELEEIIPLKHKNDIKVDILPISLKEAIRYFMIANVIRDLRGDFNDHRSMLINISRFTEVQNEIGIMVNDELKKIQNSARLYSKLGIEEALKDVEIKKMKIIFDEQFIHTKCSWVEVQKKLHNSIGSIRTLVINQKSKDKLEYEEYDQGIRVIAVGGLSLSRGLTLEGLMVSYFYRNTRMYDTLMQMGRWFGYRPNYEDLCKIYMTEASKEWYNHISEATDELRRDLKKYENSGFTPLDFGIKVRSDKNSLLVTARNKMRTSEDRNCTISLSEEAIETTDFFVSEDKNAYNKKIIDNLVDEINKKSSDIKEYSGSYVFKNVDKMLILDMLNSIDIPASNEYLEPSVISSFINQYGGNELDTWDVGFVNGSDLEEYNLIEDKKIRLVVRSFSVIGNNKDIVRMSGKSRRLGNVNDGRLGINVEQSVIKENIYIKERECGTIRYKQRNLKQKDYFTKDYIGVDRNPLLTVYRIKLKYEESSKIHINRDTDEKELLNTYKGRVVIGIGIGIPKLKHAETKYATYKVNRIYQSLEDEYDLGEEE